MTGGLVKPHISYAQSGGGFLGMGWIMVDGCNQGGDLRLFPARRLPRGFLLADPISHPKAVSVFRGLLHVG